MKLCDLIYIDFLLIVVCVSVDSCFGWDWWKQCLWFVNYSWYRLGVCIFNCQERFVDIQILGIGYFYVIFVFICMLFYEIIVNC